MTLSAATRVVGVMGDPVAHSLSPLLHNTAFAALGLDWVSVGFAVPDGQSAGAVAGLRALGIAGLSVTMPHKAAVAGLVDRLTPVAATLGAVNCLFWEPADAGGGGADHDGSRPGRLVGDSTDGAGFVAAVGRQAGFDPAGRRCLVVGAGGAARAVILALADAGATEVVVVNRSVDRATAAAAVAGDRGRVGTAADAAGADLVVDATPTGMAGTGTAAAEPLVAADRLGAGQVVADLVYHPPMTPWLAAAAERGATVVGGLGMLVHQAAAQLERWTGQPAPVAAMWEAASQA